MRFIDSAVLVAVAAGTGAQASTIGLDVETCDMHFYDKLAAARYAKLVAGGNHGRGMRKKLIYLRHAQSAWNLLKATSKGALGGWSKLKAQVGTAMVDAKLSKTGRQQSYQLRDWIIRGGHQASLANVPELDLAHVLNWEKPEREPDSDDEEDDDEEDQRYADRGAFSSVEAALGSNASAILTFLQKYDGDAHKHKTAEIEEKILAHCPDLTNEFKHARETSDGSDVSSIPSLSEHVRTVLNGESAEPVTLAASILSRALLTELIALQPRFSRHPAEKVHLLSALQELGGGVDAKASAQPCGVPVYTAMARGDTEDRNSDTNPENFVLEATRFNTTGNIGGLNGEGSVSQMSTEDRIRHFCDWALVQDTPTLVITGHSSWLRDMFRTILLHEERQKVPRPMMNRAELLLTVDKPKIKLGNASVLEFDIEFWERGLSNVYCRIVPRSAQLVYGVFEAKED